MPATSKPTMPKRVQRSARPGSVRSTSAGSPADGTGVGGGGEVGVGPGPKNEDELGVACSSANDTVCTAQAGSSAGVVWQRLQAFGIAASPP